LDFSGSLSALLADGGQRGDGVGGETALEHASGIVRGGHIGAPAIGVSLSGRRHVRFVSGRLGASIISHAGGEGRGGRAGGWATGEQDIISIRSFVWAWRTHGKPDQGSQSDHIPLRDAGPGNSSEAVVSGEGSDTAVYVGIAARVGVKEIEAGQWSV
jgi:hypothetical protein